MYKIGLIEIKCGNHELSGLCKISNTKNCKITVFTTTSLFPRVKEELGNKVSEYELILKKDNEDNLSFLKRIEKICSNRIDLVIVNTVRDWQFIFFKPNSKKLAWLRNLNYWFKDTKSLRVYFSKMKEIKNITNIDLVSNAITGPIIRNLILSNYDGVIVEYPSFKQYIHDHFNYRSKIYFLPNRPFENITLPQIGNKIRFIVAGMIQERRRDYDLILKVFEYLFSHYNKFIELYILGKPIGEYSSKIISYSEQLKKQGYNIFYSIEYVPPKIMDEAFKKSDIILSPTRVKYRSRCVEEIYSITKATGNFPDSIKFAKPCIVPETYNVADELKTSYITYKDEKELQRLIEALIHDRKRLEDLKKEALNNSKKFSLEKMHIKFDEMVEELLTGDGIN